MEKNCCIEWYIMITRVSRSYINKRSRASAKQRTAILICPIYLCYKILTRKTYEKIMQTGVIVLELLN